MNEILIRKAKYDDIEQMADININDWKKVYKGIISQKILDNLNREERIQKWQQSFNFEKTIVAEQNGVVLGYCRYEDNVVHDENDIDSEIIAIYVDYERIGKGIGRKLVEHVIDIFKKQKKNKMVIWCLEENLNARKFYEKMGGKLIENQKYFEKDEGKYKEVGYVYTLK